MLIAGLTGSIGMGKSAVARHMIARGVPVFDADAEVHRLYAGPAVAAVEAAFPGTTAEGRIDRPRLAAILAADPSGFARLEAIVHPMVHAAQRAFLHAARSAGHPVAVLEIPLLLEKGNDGRVDRIIVVSTTPENQRRRVLERPGMTPERFDQILARQLPDAEKRRRAHYVVDTGTSLEETYAAVDKVLESLARLTGEAFDKHWR